MARSAGAPAAQRAGASMPAFPCCGVGNLSRRGSGKGPPTVGWRWPHLLALNLGEAPVSVLKPAAIPRQVGGGTVRVDPAERQRPSGLVRRRGPLMAAAGTPGDGGAWGWNGGSAPSRRCAGKKKIAKGATVSPLMG